VASARLTDYEKAALHPQARSNRDPHPEEPGAASAKPGVSKDEAERGMAEMSEKFKAMGSEVYVEAAAVKESNKAL